MISPGPLLSRETASENVDTPQKTLMDEPQSQIETLSPAIHGAPSVRPKLAFLPSSELLTTDSNQSQKLISNQNADKPKGTANGKVSQPR